MTKKFVKTVNYAYLQKNSPEKVHATVEALLPEDYLRRIAGVVRNIFSESR